MINETNFGTQFSKYGKLVINLLQQKGCEDIKTKEDKLTCCCPFHQEKNSSFGINLTTGVYHCFACSEKGSITDFIAKMKNISNKQAWKELVDQGLADEFNSSYTIEDFAKEKHLEVKFLEQFGIKSAENGISVAIPYFDENSQIIRTRYRNRPNSTPRFYWDNQGNSTTLYGLWALNKYSNDYIVLVEGETDALSLWTHGIQCFGVPGAKNFKNEYAKYLQKFNKIYIHNENDEGAKQFISKITGILPINKLFIITANKVDNSCKDISDLYINNKLDINTLFATAVPISTETTTRPLESKTEKHVDIGQKLIQLLNLKYYNNNLYTYKNGVYKLATEKILKNCIVREIDITAKKNLCNESIEFVTNWLANDSDITVNENYINYLNGLYDIKNQCFIPHTPDIFTVNQIHTNYLEEIPANELVENYLEELMCNNPLRKQALLQMIGYCQTPQILMQQSMIWYGKTASNGKSTLR